MPRSRQSFCEILKCMGSISARCSGANWGFRHLADQERLVKTFNLWLRKDRGIEFWKKNGKERRARRVPLKFCWWIHVLWNKLVFLWFSQSLQVAGRGARALAGVQTLPMAVQTLPMAVQTLPMASRGSAVRACVRLLWPAPEGSAPTPRVVYWLAFWDAVKLCSQTEDFHFRNTYSWAIT